MTADAELFHRIAEPESAAARRHAAVLGLFERLELRNVEFEPHRVALAARGGARTPALWDGVRLHVGLPAVKNALETLSSSG